MTTREKILEAVARNKPPHLPLPVIDIPMTDKAASKEDFISALGNTGAKAVRVGSMDDVVEIYHKSGGGMSDIINTIPDLGAVKRDEMKRMLAPGLGTLNQTWVRGTLGVAENGAIWLEESDMINRLLPFICEHLVIVLDAGNIVGNMHEAYDRINIASEGFGVFIAGPSKTADIEQSLVVGAHGARSLVVYLIDKEFVNTQGRPVCGPDCNC